MRWGPVSQMSMFSRPWNQSNQSSSTSLPQCTANYLRGHLSNGGAREKEKNADVQRTPLLKCIRSAGLVAFSLLTKGGPSWPGFWHSKCRQESWPFIIRVDISIVHSLAFWVPCAFVEKPRAPRSQIAWMCKTGRMENNQINASVKSVKRSGCGNPKTSVRRV